MPLNKVTKPNQTIWWLNDESLAIAEVSLGHRKA